MRRATLLRTVAGVLVIGGVLGGLWAVYRPEVRTTAESSEEPQSPLLRDARAVVRLHGPGLEGSQGRATIRCDGPARTATGFWATDPAAACDALASTRGRLLSGPGCSRTDPGRLRIVVTGAFGAREFAYRTQRFGCAADDDWLGVNALATPVVPPDREAGDAPAQ